MQIKAAIPATQNAIRVGGGAGECIRIMLDLYPTDPNTIVELAALRGVELLMTFSQAQ